MHDVCQAREESRSTSDTLPQKHVRIHILKSALLDTLEMPFRLLDLTYIISLSAVSADKLNIYKMHFSIGTSAARLF